MKSVFTFENKKALKTLYIYIIITQFKLYILLLKLNRDQLDRIKDIYFTTLHTNLNLAFVNFIIIRKY